VTYNTTIEVDNPDVRLFPGMTAYVSIPVAWANSVVKIPNGALRFKPEMSDGERLKLYAKYGIASGAGATAAGRMAAASAPATGDASQGVAVASGNAGAPANGATVGQGGGNRRQGGNGGASGGQGGGGNRGQGGNGGGGGGRGAGANSQREDSSIVWKLLPDKTLEPVQVGLGVTDFTFTAMTKGKLSTSDDLVIGQSSNKTASAANRSPISGPAGGPPGVQRRF